MSTAAPEAIPAPAAVRSGRIAAIDWISRLALSPMCLWYRGYKRDHPGGWTQYIGVSGLQIPFLS